MSRLEKIPVADWDPELRRMAGADSASAIEVGPLQIFAHRPLIAKAIVGLGVAMKASRTVPERLMELVRLRIAYHNQCRSCMAIRYRDAVADGVDEALVCTLAESAPANLTPSERAALRFADRFATDHLAIDESDYDALRRHFSEAQLVEIGSWVAFCVGFGRLGATWDMVEELPPEYRQRGSERLTPSSGTPLVVR
jgi:AhpD family alkylhydroperoxidase